MARTSAGRRCAKGREYRARRPRGRTIRFHKIICLLGSGAVDRAPAPAGCAHISGKHLKLGNEIVRPRFPAQYQLIVRNACLDRIKLTGQRAAHILDADRLQAAPDEPIAVYRPSRAISIAGKPKPTIADSDGYLDLTGGK